MTEFSYQLYSSRNFPPLTDTLAMLASAGYAQVEGYGALYADPSSLGVLERGLKDTGLAMPTGHFGLAMCEAEGPRVLEIARTLGLKGVIVPHIMPADRPTDAAGWRAYGVKLARAGKPFQDAGLFFGYHNHDFEMVPTDTGELPLDLVLDGGADLKLEFDVAWAVRGKSDPMVTINRHAARLMCAHVKDIAPTGQNAHEDGWADVGDGNVPWAALMPVLRDAGCRYFVMEHDNPSDHRRFAERSLAAAQKL